MQYPYVCRRCGKDFESGVPYGEGRAFHSMSDCTGTDKNRAEGNPKRPRAELGGGDEDDAPKRKK